MRRRYGSVSDTRVGYEFRQLGSGAVLVRAYRGDMPLAAHFRGSGAMSVTAWLQGRAATLDWLAAHGYPAPRLVPERTGDPVGVAGPWLTMAVPFLPGEALARGQLGLLGAALGRLHALPAPPAYPMPGPGPGPGPGAGPRVPGLAAGPTAGLASSPPAAIPAALGWLDAVAALLPGMGARCTSSSARPRWRSSGRRRARLAPWCTGPRGRERGRHAGWPGGSSIGRTAGWPLSWIWATAAGVPPGPGRRWPACALAYSAGPGRIAAVWTVYPMAAARHSEREIRPTGSVRHFGPRRRIHFERALIDGVHGPTMDARLARLRNRIAVSQAVADIAARHLAAR
jgi:hypothetical protein